MNRTWIWVNALWSFWLVAFLQQWGMSSFPNRENNTYFKWLLWVWVLQMQGQPKELLAIIALSLNHSETDTFITTASKPLSLLLWKLNVKGTIFAQIHALKSSPNSHNTPRKLFRPISAFLRLLSDTYFNLYTLNIVFLNTNLMYLYDHLPFGIFSVKLMASSVCACFVKCCLLFAVITVAM